MLSSKIFGKRKKERKKRITEKTEEKEKIID